MNGEDDKRRMGCLLTFLLSLIFMIVMYFFFTSQLFNVDKIIVKGNERFTEESIVQISQVETGLNLFKLKSSKIASRLEKEPYIRDVKIKKKLPDKLIINVTERKACAFIKIDKDYVLIDDQGYVLERRNKKPKLTQLTGLNVKEDKSGEVIKVEQEKEFIDILTLLKVKSQSKIPFKKIKLNEDKNGVRIYIYDTLICEGDPADIAKGIDGLLNMLYDLHGKGIKKGVIKVAADGYLAYSPTVEPDDKAKK